MVFAFLGLTGCGEPAEDTAAVDPGPVEREVPREMREDPEPIDPELSEEDFIEYVAHVQFLQRDYQDKYSRALEEGNMEEAERLQGEFESEAEEIMEELGITEEEIEEFERANPQFLQDPDTQRRIMERVEELLQQ